MKILDFLLIMYLGLTSKFQSNYMDRAKKKDRRAVLFYVYYWLFLDGCSQGA